MRVLQIRSTVTDLQTQVLADALLQKLADIEFVTRRIGSGGDDVLLPMSVVHLRRARVDADLTHAIGGRALTAAVMGTRGPIVYSPVGFPTAREISWLRAAIHYRDIHVVASTESAARCYLARGIASDRVHMIPPGVSAGDVPRQRDLPLRKKLGFSGSNVVIFVPPELTPISGHGLAMWSVSLLHALDPKYKLLFWGRGRSLESIHRLRGRLINPNLLCVAPDHHLLGQLFGAADVVMFCNIKPVPTYSIALAMASGLPIVSTTTRTNSELLEDRRNALLVTKPSPKMLAQRVLDAINDGKLQWKISDQARSDSYEFYSQSRMIDAWQKLYAEIAQPAGVRV